MKAPALARFRLKQKESCLLQVLGLGDWELCPCFVVGPAGQGTNPTAVLALQRFQMQHFLWAFHFKKEKIGINWVKIMPGRGRQIATKNESWSS